MPTVINAPTVAPNNRNNSNSNNHNNSNNPLLNNGTYNPLTRVYTAPNGNQYSMPQANVPKNVQIIYNNPNTNNRGNSGGGGNSSNNNNNSNRTNNPQSRINPNINNQNIVIDNTKQIEQYNQQLQQQLQRNQLIRGYSQKEGEYLYDYTPQIATQILKTNKDKYEQTNLMLERQWDAQVRAEEERQKKMSKYPVFQYIDNKNEALDEFVDEKTRGNFYWRLPAYGLKGAKDFAMLPYDVFKGTYKGTDYIINNPQKTWDYIKGSPSYAYNTAKYGINHPTEIIVVGTGALANLGTGIAKAIYNDPAKAIGENLILFIPLGNTKKMEEIEKGISKTIKEGKEIKLTYLQSAKKYFEESKKLKALGKEREALNSLIKSQYFLTFGKLEKKTEIGINILKNKIGNTKSNIRNIWDNSALGKEIENHKRIQEALKKIDKDNVWIDLKTSPVDGAKFLERYTKAQYQRAKEVLLSKRNTFDIDKMTKELINRKSKHLSNKLKGLKHNISKVTQPLKEDIWKLKEYTRYYYKQGKNIVLDKSKVYSDLIKEKSQYNWLKQNLEIQKAQYQRAKGIYKDKLSENIQIKDYDLTNTKKKINKLTEMLKEKSQYNWLKQNLKIQKNQLKKASKMYKDKSIDLSKRVINEGKSRLNLIKGRLTPIREEMPNLDKIDERIEQLKKKGENRMKSLSDNQLKEELGKSFDRINKRRFGNMKELYHGTTKDIAKNIEKEGFKTKGTQGVVEHGSAVSLTGDKAFAESFSRRSTLNELLKGKKSTPKVLKIKMPVKDYLKAKKNTLSKQYDETVVNPLTDELHIMGKSERAILNEAKARYIRKGFEKLGRELPDKPIIPKKEFSWREMMKPQYDKVKEFYKSQSPIRIEKIPIEKDTMLRPNLQGSKKFFKEAIDKIKASNKENMGYDQLNIIKRMEDSVKKTEKKLEDWSWMKRNSQEELKKKWENNEKILQEEIDKGNFKITENGQVQIVKEEAKAKQVTKQEQLLENKQELLNPEQATKLESLQKYKTLQKLLQLERIVTEQKQIQKYIQGLGFKQAFKQAQPQIQPQLSGQIQPQPQRQDQGQKYPNPTKLKYTFDTPEKIIKKPKIIYPEGEYYTKAWQPIFIDKYGKEKVGGYYKDYKSGVSEGFIEANKNPVVKFTLQPVQVKMGLVKQGRATNLGYNFIQKGNMFYKKKQNTNNNNWMSMMRKPSW